MASETVFRARKFRVEQVHVPGSDGMDHDYQIVRVTGAAVILPLLSADEVVLIENRRIPVGKTLLELPAGMIDPPEAPEQTAARELIEETGYSAGKLEHLLTFLTTPGFCDERMFAYLATDLVQGDQRLEPTEKIKPVVMSYDAALAAIGSGEIIDAKTMVTLLHYDRFVRSGGVE